MGGQFGLILSFFFWSSFGALLSATTVGGLAVVIEAVSLTGATSFCWALSLSPPPDVPSSCSSPSAGGVGGLAESVMFRFYYFIYNIIKTMIDASGYLKVTCFFNIIEIENDLLFYIVQFEALPLTTQQITFTSSIIKRIRNSRSFS